MGEEKPAEEDQGRRPRGAKREGRRLVTTGERPGGGGVPLEVAANLPKCTLSCTIGALRVSPCKHCYVGSIRSVVRQISALATCSYCKLNTFAINLRNYSSTLGFIVDHSSCLAGG
jgi:hypothetical protein